MNELEESPSELSRKITRRTKICAWIIFLGLANFLLYTVVYLSLDGDAINGYVEAPQAGGETAPRYYLSAHGQPVEVSRAVWIYSAVHSTSIWITVGAVLLAMLTIAKDRIVSSMRSTIIRGRTFIAIVATIVTLISMLVTISFVIYMVRQLGGAGRPGAS